MLKYNIMVQRSSPVYLPRYLSIDSKLDEVLDGAVTAALARHSAKERSDFETLRFLYMMDPVLALSKCMPGMANKTGWYRFGMSAKGTLVHLRHRNE